MADWGGWAWVELALYDTLWSSTVALGYGILFAVPWRLLPGCVLVGALGHLLRTLLMAAGLGIEAATLFGATAVGFAGWELAKRWRTPALVFTVPGVIPMAPGTFAYGAMLGIIDLAGSGELETGSAALWTVGYNATKALLILGALAVGIAAPTLLNRRRRINR
jgi:uncharacterized membrane protein YjjB (DUF3815 family)